MTVEGRQMECSKNQSSRKRTGYKHQFFAFSISSKFEKTFLTILGKETFLAFLRETSMVQKVSQSPLHLQGDQFN